MGPIPPRLDPSGWAIELDELEAESTGIEPALPFQADDLSRIARQTSIRLLSMRTSPHECSQLAALIRHRKTTRALRLGAFLPRCPRGRNRTCYRLREWRHSAIELHEGCGASRFCDWAPETLSSQGLGTHDLPAVLSRHFSKLLRTVRASSSQLRKVTEGDGPAKENIVLCFSFGRLYRD